MDPRVKPAGDDKGWDQLHQNTPCALATIRFAPNSLITVIGIAGVMVCVTRPGHAIIAVTMSIPGHFVAWMKTAPIESAIHDIAVADGRVGDDVGTVRVGVMPGTMMMSALRIGRGSSRNRQHTQRDCRGDCDYKLLHGISSASHV